MEKIERFFHSLFGGLVEEEKAKLDPMYHLKQPNAETKMALEELYKDYKPPVRHSIKGGI